MPYQNTAVTPNTRYNCGPNGWEQEGTGISGTPGYVPVFTGTNTLGNSTITSGLSVTGETDIYSTPNFTTTATSASCDGTNCTVIVANSAVANQEMIIGDGFADSCLSNSGHVYLTSATSTQIVFPESDTSCSGATTGGSGGKVSILPTISVTPTDIHLQVPGFGTWYNQTATDATYDIGPGGLRFGGTGDSNNRNTVAFDQSYGQVQFNNSTLNGAVPVVVTGNTGTCGTAPPDMGSTLNCGFQVDGGALITGGLVVNSGFLVTAPAYVYAPIYTMSGLNLYPSGGSSTTAWTTDGGMASLFTNPMTTLGDTIYGGASGAATRLAGNTTTTKKFLSQTGDGTNSAAPVWGALVAADIPSLSGSYLPLTGGTLTGALNGTSASFSGTIAAPTTYFKSPVAQLLAFNISACTGSVAIDTNALNAAISAAHGGWIILPPNSICQVSSLTVTDGNSFYLDLNGSTLQLTGTGGGACSSGVNGYLQFTQFITQRSSQVMITNGSISVPTTNSSCAINLSNSSQWAQGLWISHVYFTGPNDTTSTGIWMGFGGFLYITDSIINYFAHPVNLVGSQTNVVDIERVEANSSVVGQNYIFQIANPEAVTFKNNTCEGSPCLSITAGESIDVEANWAGDGSPSASTPWFSITSNSATVKDNWISPNTAYTGTGIAVYSPGSSPDNQAEVSENWLWGLANPIINTATGTYIHNNNIQTSTNGIQLNGMGEIVTGNRVSATSGNGITMNGAAGWVYMPQHVANNILYDAGVHCTGIGGNYIEQISSFIDSTCTAGAMNNIIVETDSGSIISPAMTTKSITLSGDSTFTKNPRAFITMSTGMLSPLANANYSPVGIVQSGTIENIVGSAASFTCTVSPVVTLYDCGTTAGSCSSPTLLGSVTITGATFNVGTISNATLTAGHYLVWSIPTGACTTANLSASAEYRTN
jgi:hypothetical protein